MTFKVFTYQRQIVESDLDTLGHVNNASYLKIFEEARWDFITKNGYGLKEVIKRQISPIVLKVEVFYRKELTNRTWARVESQCEEMMGLRFVLKQKIFREDGKLATEASFLMATMDLQARSLVRLPKDFVHAIGYDDPSL